VSGPLDSMCAGLLRLQEVLALNGEVDWFKKSLVRSLLFCLFSSFLVRFDPLGKGPRYSRPALVLTTGLSLSSQHWGFSAKNFSWYLRRYPFAFDALLLHAEQRLLFFGRNEKRTLPPSKSGRTHAPFAGHGVVLPRLLNPRMGFCALTPALFLPFPQGIRVLRCDVPA